MNPANKTWGGRPPNNSAFTAFREAGRNCIRLYADLNGEPDVVTGHRRERLFLLADARTSGTPFPETRGSVGGQADSGQPWVTASAGAEEPARDIVPNPGRGGRVPVLHRHERCAEPEYPADPARLVDHRLLNPDWQANRAQSRGW